MRNILLFSRLSLVHLYGSISPKLSDNSRVIHLAYSSMEEEILRSEYGITEVHNFKELVSAIYETEQIDVALCNKIDEDVIHFSESRFCLNSSIQSDRTLENLDYDECLILSQVYYKFWIKFIEEYKIDIIFHEITALLFLHLSAIVARKCGARYLSQIQIRGESRYSWIFVDGENGDPVELSFFDNQYSLTHDNIERVREYLQKQRAELGLFFPELRNKQNYKNQFRILVKRTVKLILSSFSRKFEQNSGCVKRPIDHVEQFLFDSNAGIWNKFKTVVDDFIGINYDYFEKSNNYFYYPMHVEPEAVILYWAEGLYKNQVKLIENIAAQLPPNCYLYVKVHPLDKKNRNILDYQRIKAIPNLKLIGPEVPSVELITHSRGVITINGTSGYEGILLNKQVFTLGNSFFETSDRVIKIRHVRDLRQELYRKYNVEYQDDEHLYRFIFSILDVSHEGFVAFFRNLKDVFQIDLSSNAAMVAESVNQLIRKLD